MNAYSTMAGAVCAAAIAFCANAEALTMGEIASQVGKDRIIHAEFTQTRRLAALKRPVVSRGKVVVAGGQGIVWEIEHPYRATYVIRKDAIAEVDQAGRRKTGPAEQAQHVRRAAHLIGALLELNEEALAEQFSASVGGNIDQWTVDLASRDALARFIAKITLRGGPFVDEVVIVETSGDSSRLEFHSARSGDPLSSREVMLLQGR